MFVGFDGSGTLSTTDVLDLNSMAFTEGPDILLSRSGCAAIVIDAHHVLVVGGYSKGGHLLNTTEILDVDTLTFTAGPDMRSGRNRCILVVGGSNPTRRLSGYGGGAGPGHDGLHTGAEYAYSPIQLRSCEARCAPMSRDTTEVLDIVTVTFTAGPVMGSARHKFAAVPLESTHILLVGGAVSTTEVRPRLKMHIWSRDNEKLHPGARSRDDAVRGGSTMESARFFIS